MDLPEGIGAIGIDDKDMLYYCLSETIKPTDKGITGLKCTNSGEKTLDGWTISSNTFTQDAPKDDEGMKTLADRITDLKVEYGEIKDY